MFIIRIERRADGREPVILWLKSVVPVRLGDREQAMQFPAKGDAVRAAAAAKLVGWSLEDA